MTCEVGHTKKQTCCFTGQRKIPPSEQVRLTEKLEQTIIGLIRSGIRYFDAGGALGFDTLAAQTVIKLRNTYPQIKLVLILPCKTQTRGWKAGEIEIYEVIKAAADEIQYTSEEYTRGCMHKRNRQLVDSSTVYVAYQTECTGGTAYTVDYARRRGVPVINLGEEQFICP